MTSLITEASPVDRPPAVDMHATMHLLVGALLARFGVDYDRQVAAGVGDFEVSAWYRFKPVDSIIEVSVLVGVSRPVLGLGAYLTDLASEYTLALGGDVVFTTQLRLLEDVDVAALKPLGWEHCDVPSSSSSINFG